MSLMVVSPFRVAAVAPPPPGPSGIQYNELVLFGAYHDTLLSTDTIRTYDFASSSLATQGNTLTTPTTTAYGVGDYTTAWVFGGFNFDSGLEINTSDKYSYATNGIALSGSSLQTAFGRNGGHVSSETHGYAFNGSNEAGTTYVLTFSNESVSSNISFNGARGNDAIHNDVKAYIGGGSIGSTSLTTIQRYNFGGSTIGVSATLQHGRMNMGFGCNKTVGFWMGGYSYQPVQYTYDNWNDKFVYATETSSISTVLTDGSNSNPGSGSSIVNNVVVLIGGYDALGAGRLSSGKRFNIATEAWSITTSLPAAESSQTGQSGAHAGLTP